MQKFDEFITSIFVSTVIGLALSYVTILIPFIMDISFMEAVAVYHFWIHINAWLKSFGKNEDED